jgi:ferredoxin
MPRRGGGTPRGFGSLIQLLGDFPNRSVLSDRTSGGGPRQGRPRNAHGGCRRRRRHRKSGALLTPWVAQDPIARRPSSASTSVIGPLPGAPHQVKRPVAHVDPERCVGCGACREVCPTGSIKVEYDHAVVAEGCIGCGICVEECPAGALSLG